MELQALYDTIQFDDRGLVPAIVQDIHTGAVLMLAYMNQEAIRLTLETKRATYYSRSRKCIWVKGETSGHTQEVYSIHYDCDADTILLQVNQVGPACHNGTYTCFNNCVLGGDHIVEFGAQAILRDYKTIKDRQNNPQADSYTNYLFDKGIDTICKKVGEEATEVVIAAKNGSKEELIYEIADLFYHTLVIMADIGVTPDELFAEMDKRR